MNPDFPSDPGPSGTLADNDHNPSEFELNDGKPTGDASDDVDDTGSQHGALQLRWFPSPSPSLDDHEQWGAKWERVDVQSLEASSPSASLPASESTSLPPLKLPQSFVFPNVLDGHRGYNTVRIAHDTTPRNGARADSNAQPRGRKPSRGRSRVARKRSAAGRSDVSETKRRPDSSVSPQKATGVSSSSGDKDKVSTQPPLEEATTVKVDGEDALGASTMSEIWPLYVQRTGAEDKETVQAWNTDLDSILIFAALFSSALTTFIIESYRSLQPDPTSELLQAILVELRMTRDPANAGGTPVQQFKVAASAVRVNVYWFTSLILSLSTALIAILAKQWVNYLLAGLSPVPSARARHRQYRMDGMRRWNLPAVLSFLPVLLHISLLLFFTGLIDFIWGMNDTVAVVSAVLVCITAFMYIVANLLAYIYPDCPFKTSVTVFFALVIDYLIIAYVSARIAVVKIGRHLLRHWRYVSQYWRPRDRRSNSNSIEDGAISLHRTGTFIASESRHYESLRITSLRHQDEKFIEANKSFMDSRILLWLMRNADRFHDAEKLSRAIVHFPYLVLHRRLFIHKGVFAYLERLLRSWMKDGFNSSIAGQERGEAITAAIHALSVLESEVGVDGPEYKAALDPEDVVSEVKTPFIMIQPTTNPTASPLSPLTFPVVHTLLGDAGNLPFPLLASALRLSVRLPLVQPASAVSYKSVVEQFLQRVSQLQSSSDDFRHITHAVNTIIYLALHDASYPDRVGFAIPFIGDARHWLTYISTLLPRSTIPHSARFQLSWAVCVLERSLGTTVDPETRLGAIVKPRIPRLREVSAFAGHLTSLVTSGPGADPDVFCAALAALEGLLWCVTPERKKDVNHVVGLLLPIRFVSVQSVQLARLLTLERVRELGPQGVKAAISMTRIAVYLSIFHTPRPAILKGSPAGQILHNAFSVLRHLATQSADSLPIQSPTETAAVMAKPLPREVRHWIYRASSRIVVLIPLAYRGGSSLSVDPHELAFAEEASAGSVATALVTALQQISEDMGPGTDRPSIDEHTQESFLAVLNDVFARATPNPIDQGEPQDINRESQRHPETADIVVHFVGQKGLTVMLGCAPLLCSTETWMRTCKEALRAVSAMLSTAKYGPNQDALVPVHPTTATTVGRGGHYGASGLATALRQQYASVNETLAMWTDGHFTNPMVENVLVDFIRISGQLAFYTADTNVIGYDVLGGLLVFLSALLSTRERPKGRLLTARRQGWGTLGSIVTLCALDGKVLREDTDIARYFRFDVDGLDSEDRIAAGLVRLLMLTNIENIPDPDSHCKLCRLQPHEHIRLLLQLSGHTRVAAAKVFKRAVIVVLDAIATLWTEDDAEALAVRERLCRHGLASRLVVISLLEGRSGEVAGEIIAKMTDSEKNGYISQD